MTLFTTHYQLALDSLRKNRSRTFLSALGIAIGVASIVLIMSLTGSINSLLSANSDKNNANLILVRPQSGKEFTDSLIDELTYSSQYTKSSLTLDDVTEIQKLDHVADVAPIASTTTAVTVSQEAKPSTTIVATNSSLVNTTPLTLKNGQFFNDNLKQNNSAVIGYDIAQRLFGSTNAISKTFQYNNQQFIIVGVLDKVDSPINYNGVNFDNSILIDLNFAATFESSIQIQQINVRTNTTDATESVADAITALLKDKHHSDSTFSVLTGSNNFTPTGSMLSIVTALLTIVAGISLVVGGVGIMNIMLVSVSERTREIGIRKAVGASSGNILLQFLFESVILCVIGGLLGFSLGYIGAFAISLVTPFTPHISLNILAVTGATSLAAGVIFGLYPAAKAAAKDPIASLKNYQ